MYRFHVNLVAQPAGRVCESPITLRGTALMHRLDGDGVPLTFASPLPVTWEEVAARLQALPRMIFEPDGSFVWSGETDNGATWHVSGHLFDFHFEGALRLHRVELNGECPTPQFERLLTCVGAPTESLSFQLVREGVTLDAENFRRWAPSKDTAP